MLILFDEFGRFLEFAADRPHIAGDAALQQIYEGVQNNSDKCSMLCLNQYELKVYLSRISRDSQSSIQRYITRYDSARKYYLSSNLETLFAHLIKKKDADFLSSYLKQSKIGNHIFLKDINRWFPSSEQQSVWKESELFHQVIIQGCWPLHPLATWFLCHSSAFLQDRTAITLVAEAFKREENHALNLEDTPWSISATALFDSQLIKDLVAAEEYGQGGAVAQSYEAVTQKYQHDFSTAHRHVLLAVLIAVKLGLKVTDQQESHKALSALSGLSHEIIEKVTRELASEYGVLEWNERFLRYEIIGDAVPRSEFLKFLRNKTQDISSEQVEEIFSAHCKAWAELHDIDPQFAAENNISTPEWNFYTSCAHTDALSRAIDNAIIDWKDAVKPDENRGQLIYCYIRGDEKIDTISHKMQSLLETKMKEKGDKQAPILIVLFHDKENKVRKILAEYSILTGPLTAEEKQKFAHFIEDHKNKLLEELKLSCEDLTKKREYYCSKFFDIGTQRLKKICQDIFLQSYPEIIPFPFDGFATTRGNAVKDCRLITTELLTGNLNHDWIATQTVQTQNRATRLLKSWDVMGDDGLIRMHPRHQKLGRLISFIEDTLESEKALNVGQLFRKLIAPPYGFNVASAGLALGVFLAPRQNLAVLLLDDQDISPGAWISKGFIGNFLNLKILDKTTLRYVSDSEASEWQKFLSKWEIEQTHIGNLNFLEKAQQLRVRVSLPPGQLFERYTRFEEHARKSIEALRGLDKFYEKEARSLEYSYPKRDVVSMSWVAKNLIQRLKTMDNQQEFWVEDQYALLKKLYSQARESVIQCFDDWLPQQSCISSQKVPDFRRKLIDQVGHNLKTIDLKELTHKVEAHASKVISQIEERQRIFYIVNEAKAYLDSHQNRIVPQSRVVELRAWIKGAKELVVPLTRAGQQINAPEIMAIMQKLDRFQEACKAQIKQHADRFGKLLNLSFRTLEDIRNGQREVDQLLSIFSEDNPSNIEDLYAMHQQLKQFENDFVSWNDQGFSNEALRDMAESRVATLLAEQDEEDELPWDVGEVYKDILSHLLQEREKAASRWCAGIAIDINKVKEMDARSCQLNIGKIENPPIYLSSEQIEEIDNLRHRLTHRMSELQLDGVLEMYRNLHPALQKRFLELVSQ